MQYGIRIPTLKTLGYSQQSLRDREYTSASKGVKSAYGCYFVLHASRSMSAHRREPLGSDVFRFGSGSSGAGAGKLSRSNRGSARSFHRFEQHTENIRGKNKGEMAFVKALEIFSNEADPDCIGKIVEED